MKIAVLARRFRYGAAGFSPASLFSAGEQGAWYDPSDFTTMFQDSAGATPVTAVEQIVGLILDKSKGLVLGSELLATGTVGLTGAATAATYNAGTGAGSASRVNAFNQSFVSFAVTSGRTYLVDIENTGGVTLAIRPASLGGALVTVTAGTRTTARLTATDAALAICASGDAATASFTVYSIALLAGNHAFQATSASRPVLSARVNLLLATNTLSTQSVTTLADTYTLAFSGAGTVTASGTNIGVYTAGSNSLVCTAGTLTLTVVGSVTFADLRVTNDGVGLPAYQRVTTSTDYDTTGFPYYLRFDGTDDSLATSTFTPGTDKAQVFTGLRKLSNAVQVIAEFSAAITSNNGSFNLYNFTDTKLYYESKGTTLRVANGDANASPYTTVLSGISDISGDSVAVRQNGVQVSQSTSDQGTGNYLAYPLYIGRRGGSTLPLNGRIYSLIIRFGANLTETQTEQTEQWISGKMGGGYYPTGYDFLVDANGDQITDASGNPLYTQALYT